MLDYRRIAAELGRTPESTVFSIEDGDYGSGGWASFIEIRAYRKKRGVLDFVFGYPTCPLRMWNPVSTAGSSLLYDWMPLS